MTEDSQFIFWEVNGYKAIVRVFLVDPAEAS